MSVTNKAIGLTVALIVIAFMVPIGITQLIAVNTTTWPTGLVSVWDNLPIIAGLGLLLAILSYAVVKVRQ